MILLASETAAGTDATGTAQEIAAWAAAAAFTIGVFPSEGLRWLMMQGNRILSRSVERTNELPLGRLLGLGPWHEARLVEMGIDDTQNLATVDIRRLLLTTQFDTQEIVSWIDQAILYVKVGDKIDRFREARVGSFHELRQVLNRLSIDPTLEPQAAEREEREEALKRLALALGMADADELARLREDSNFPNYAHISEYYARVSAVAHQRASVGMESATGAYRETDYERAIAVGERLLAPVPQRCGPAEHPGVGVLSARET